MEESMTDKCTEVKSSPPPDSNPHPPATPPRWSAPIHFEKLSIFRRWRDRLFVPWSLAVIFLLISMTQELPTTAIGMILADRLSLDPDAFIAYYTLAYVPWSLKPIFGLISDLFPIYGYRRCPWAFFCLIGAAITYFCMARYAVDYRSILIIGVIQSIFEATTEVAMDSLAIEYSNALPCIVPSSPSSLSDNQNQASGESSPSSLILSSSFFSSSTTTPSSNSLPESSLPEGPLPPTSHMTREEIQAKVQSASMTIRTTGSVVAAAIQILLFVYLDVNGVLYISALVPLFTILFLPFVKEKKIINYKFPTWKEIVNKKKNYEKMKNMWKIFKIMYIPVLFIFLWNSPPTTSDVYYDFLFDVYEDFPDWQLSLQNFTGLLGGLFGSLFYWKFCTKWNLKWMFAITTLLSIMGDCTTIILAKGNNYTRFGIPDQWWVPSNSIFVGFFDRLALMPTLVLAAQSCPPGLEASLYSLFTAMNNVSYLLSSYLSIQLTYVYNINYDDYSNLWKMIIICQMLRFLPLVLVPLLPEKSRKTIESSTSTNNTSTTDRFQSEIYGSTSTPLLEDYEESNTSLLPDKVGNGLIN